MKKLIAIALVLLFGFFFASYTLDMHFTQPIKYKVGEVIDEFNGVKVYYNGMVSHVEGRNTTSDGYNLGLKYQCVEFVKRYYNEFLHHKMPDSYGHAKDFYNQSITDGQKNPRRGLIQYQNPSAIKPKVSDLLIMDGNTYNPYGHVAIIAKVSDTSIEIVQQNPGPTAPSRERYRLKQVGGKWMIERSDLLGWLRKE